ncbi:MAG: DUF1330 domain-containing protein [Saprospiraceae bacterium]|nr:DUF1330 domain-containing protein [Lewinella sp.]
MIYLTQLIYLQSGQEKIFDEFEAAAIPLIAQYRGELLFRIRPPEGSVIEAAIESPYEIHFVSFPSEEEFQQFMQDEERKKFLHLKEQAIRSTILVKGNRL